LKIAILSPFIHPIVEPFMGGTEASVYRLASELSRQEVEVVCYACEGSVIPGVEIRTCGVATSALAYPRSPQEMTGEEILTIRAYEDTVMYQAIVDALDDPSIDIFHNNSFSGIPFLLSRFLNLPMVHTLRLPPILPSMTETLHFCKIQDIPLKLVTLSHAQAQLWQPYYPVSQIIYNGLDFEAIPRSHCHDGTLAFVGRIDPSKGVEDAIEVASHLGKTLSIYGALQPYNTSYFEKHIHPLLQSHPNVLYYGLVDQQTLYQRLKLAQALLFPVKWDEPFGNVIIEAMAVGTPVIMYDRGSARELIAEGISGYVVSADNVIEMASAVERTDTIDRSACADYAREQFSLKKTAKDYFDLMQRIC
jgi:glycosyltransferase involved in cell wall biosynthesis